MFQIKWGNRDDLLIIFHIFPYNIQIYVVTHHKHDKSCFAEMVLSGHNICFGWEIRKIVSELSFVSGAKVYCVSACRTHFGV